MVPENIYFNLDGIICNNNLRLFAYGCVKHDLFIEVLNDSSCNLWFGGIPDTLLIVPLW